MYVRRWQEKRRLSERLQIRCSWVSSVVGLPRVSIKAHSSANSTC
jgi:hypothetical protein